MKFWICSYVWIWNHVLIDRLLHVWFYGPMAKQLCKENVGTCDTSYKCKYDIKSKIKDEKNLQVFSGRKRIKINQYYTYTFDKKVPVLV